MLFGDLLAENVTARIIIDTIAQYDRHLNELSTTVSIIAIFAMIVVTVTTATVAAFLCIAQISF